MREHATAIISEKLIRKTRDIFNCEYGGS